MVRDLLKEVLLEETVRENNATSLAVAFAKKLRKEMEQQGVTQEELAARMGTTQGYVPYLLNGKSNLSLKTIAKVLTALDRKFSFEFEAME